MPAVLSTLLVSTLLVALTTLAAASQEHESLPALEHDAGTVFPGALVHHAFVIENPEAQAWTITGLHSSCSCTVATPASLVIEPGGSGLVPVDFAVGETVNHRVEAVITADIRRPDGTRQLPMHVMAQVASPIEGPHRVVLEAPLHTATLTFQRGQHPAAWVRLTARVVSGETVLALGEVSEHAGTWSIPITATPGSWSGTFFGRIELSCLDAAGTPLPYHPNITAVVRCPGPWNATPASLLIGAVADGNTASGTTRIRSTGPDLTTASIESSDARLSATLDPATGRLQVAFLAAGSTGSANGWIDVVQGDQRLRIPVIAAVTEVPPSIE